MGQESGDQGDVVIDGHVVRTIATDEEAFAEQARYLAETRGGDVDEYVRMLKVQQEASLAMVDHVNSEEFAGAEWVDEGKTFEVGFKGDPSDEVVGDLEARGVPVRVRANVGLSYNEVQERVRGLTDHLVGQGLDDFSVSPSPFGEGLDVSIDDTAHSRQIAQRPRIDESSLKARVGMPVSLQWRPAGTGQLHARYGGSRLVPNAMLDDPQPYCSTAFATLASGTVSGFVTAGHCYVDANKDGLTLKHQHSLSGSAITTHLEGTPVNWDWGDFGWYTTNEIELDDFFSDGTPEQPSVKTDLSNFGVPFGGQFLFRYGRRTGLKDGEVYRRGETRTWDGQTYRRLVSLHRSNGAVGDSGAPWFSGRVAYGVHHGAEWINLFTRDLFSEAQYVDEALGVQIRTS